MAQKSQGKTIKHSPESNGSNPKSKQSKSTYFLSLTIENVRCFGSPSQTLDLSNGKGRPKQWTIILGDNGTGKTTLLQTFVSISPVEAEFQKTSEGNLILSRLLDVLSLPEYNLLRRKSNRGAIVKANFLSQARLTQTENGKLESLELDIGRIGLGNASLADYRDFENFICYGYGASRKMGKTSIIKDEHPTPYLTLFSEDAELINAEEWLLRIDYAAAKASTFQNQAAKQLEIIKKVLIQLLPIVKDIRFSELTEVFTTFLEFETDDGWFKIHDLSVGYRTLIAWMVDFASRMFERYPNSENPLAEPAVVLIDEIDLHLHPKWQRDLIDYLTNLFPNTQFIVTTHSPLIVQAAAARDANIVVCRREGDHVVIDQSVEAVRGWRADQILTSDLFDLPSARPKETEELLEQRKRILSKAKLTKADEKKLKEISEKLGSLPVMEDPKYDEAMDIILRAAEKLGKDKTAAND